MIYLITDRMVTERAMRVHIESKIFEVTQSLHHNKLTEVMFMHQSHFLNGCTWFHTDDLRRTSTRLQQNVSACLRSITNSTAVSHNRELQKSF